MVLPPARQTLQPFRAKFPLHSPRGGFSFMAPSPNPSGFLFKGIPPPVQSLVVLESDWGYISPFL